VKIKNKYLKVFASEKQQKYIVIKMTKEYKKKTAVTL
jgi:hypothetical protein